MKRFHGIIFVGGMLLTFAVSNTVCAMQAQELEATQAQVEKQVDKDDELAGQECSQYCKGCEDCIELNYSKCCKKNCCKKLICPKKKKKIRVANLTDEVFAEDTKGLGVKDTIVKYLKKNALVRGLRNIAEIACLPTVVQTLCFCPGSDLIYCCVAGGFVVFTLADVGLSVKDLYDNTVTIEEENEDEA